MHYNPNYLKKISLCHLSESKYKNKQAMQSTCIALMYSYSKLFELPNVYSYLSLLAYVIFYIPRKIHVNTNTLLT